MKQVLIIGSGLGGLSTALRLTSRGFSVTILEKNTTSGGRLNELAIDGFKFDIGPSFMSMTYELDELFTSCQLENSLHLSSLDPIQQTFFDGRDRPFRLWKDVARLAAEFDGIETDVQNKVERYLAKAAEIFHDTERTFVKSNFDGLGDYIKKFFSVPIKHAPYLFRSMWREAERRFTSDELRMMFCLVGFFLGSTPFKTPAIYSLLNYVEMRHNGYWIVQGGMYQLVRVLEQELRRRGVVFHFGTEVVEVEHQTQRAVAVRDRQGKRYEADIFVCNSDAAAFRGQVLRRRRFNPARLDKMDWSLAPFTIYLGVKGRMDNLIHHNYFLGADIREYTRELFRSPDALKKPYYYVNVPSRWCSDYAPKGCESVFVLCLVPDLRFKKDWSDAEQITANILSDLTRRSGYDLAGKTLVRKVLTPVDWEKKFNLYRGSGLGLCHGLDQVGPFRPANKDEDLSNFYYVGASTVPGTGLPMVIVGSKLVLERILNEQ